MKNKVETTQLEFEKSNFLIDLIEHTNGQLYVEIIQTRSNTTCAPNPIKINPSVLSDIIKVLQNYHAKLLSTKKLSYKHVTEFEQEKIVSHYLRGISINDLAMQFDQQPELIEMILRNKKIEIIKNPPSKYRYRKYRRKK